MPPVSEQRLFDALATLTRAFADGGMPDMMGEAHDARGADGASPAIEAMDAKSRRVWGDASLEEAAAAAASRGGDGAPIRSLLGGRALVRRGAGGRRDPPAEILGIAAEDARVKQEI